MLPIVGVPETIRRGMAPYRAIFCRDAGFEHVSRYVTSLLLSPNKTLQGLYDVQVWASERAPSRRAMHAAVFEAGWAAEALMPHHRAVIAREHRGRGREVVSLDWTYVHHERGPKIWGIKTFGTVRRCRGGVNARAPVWLSISWWRETDSALGGRFSPFPDVLTLLQTARH
jgi:hypothetical protein